MDILVHSLRRVVSNHACSTLSKNIFHSQCEYLYCVFKNWKASNAGFVMLRFDAWDGCSRQVVLSFVQLQNRYENMSFCSIHNNRVKLFLVGIEHIGMFSGKQWHLTTFLNEQLSMFSLCPWTAITTVSECETNLQLFNHLNIFLIDLWGLVCGLILFLTHSKPTQWGDLRCFSDVRCIILPNSSQVILQKLFEEPLIIWS